MTTSKARTTRKSAPAKTTTAKTETAPEAPEDKTPTEGTESTEGAEGAEGKDETSDTDEAPDAGESTDAPEDEKPEDKPAEAPRQPPAVAELDAPAPAAPNGVRTPKTVRDGSGQLSVDMVNDKPAELRSALYDAETGKTPDPDKMFVQQFAHGTQMVCIVRLCELVWVPGFKTPNSRLVMPRGQITDKAYAEQLTAVVRAQVKAEAEAAEREAAEQE